MYSHAPWLVLSVFGLTLIWLSLLAYFFYYLKRSQPEQFELLGKPDFYDRGGFMRVLQYIYLRNHRRLGDLRFSLLCDLMVLTFSATLALVAYGLLQNGTLPSWHSAP